MVVLIPSAALFKSFYFSTSPVDIQLGLGVGADEDGGLVVGDRVPALVHVQLEGAHILAGI